LTQPVRIVCEADMRVVPDLHAYAFESWIKSRQQDSTDSRAAHSQHLERLEQQRERVSV
jgi:hypothetical protein